MIIEQAVFGYSNGHRLLASSMDIPTSMLKILEPLTDWSGADYDNGFSEYFTGYFFKEENIFVICKTWYAHELTRPGCAWSHAFLINVKYLGDHRLSSYISKRFNRPNAEMNYNIYKEKIILDNLSNITNYNETTYFENVYAKKIISSVYENNTPVMIPALTNDILSSTFLMLWLTIGGNILRDNSFCTGSFSNRVVNKKKIDFQVVPQIKAKTILRSDKNAISIENIDIGQSAWINSVIDSYVKNTDNKLVSFIEQISSNSNDKFVIKACAQVLESIDRNDLNIERLTAFVGINLILDDQKEIATNTVIGIINRIFSSESSAYTLDTQVNFFKELLSIESESKQIFDFNKLCETLKQKKFETVSLVNKLFNFILNNEINEIGETFIDLIAQYVVNQNDVREILGNSYIGCHILIKSNGYIALKENVWQAPLDEQIRIIETLQEYSDIKSDWYAQKLLQVIFENASKEVIEKLYGLFGANLVEYYLSWSDSCLETKLVLKWIDICKYDMKRSLDFVETYRVSIISKYLWFYINPYEVKVTNINHSYWNEYFKTNISYSNDIKRQNEFACFILPLIIKSPTGFSDDIICFAYKTVHSILENDKMPYNQWIKLSQILPEIAWNNSWDKCKRLRKASKKAGYSFKFKQKSSSNN